jgi:GNAT superfamily N-acetyltransferase
MKQLMEHVGDFNIKRVCNSDVVNLSKFFIIAYGEQTVFQSEDYLRWYFDIGNSEQDKPCDSILIMNQQKEIVSFYGIIMRNIIVNGERTKLAWGVNAFTLKEYRGLGLNSKLVEFLKLNNELNGVIGFTVKTLQFYNKNSYHIFRGEKFQRYVFVISLESTVKIIKLLNQNSQKFEAIIKSKGHSKYHSKKYSITKITIEILKTTDVLFDTTEVFTCERDKSFLLQRFLTNPFINYDLYGIINDNIIESYIACREEVLLPTTDKVFRVIDIFGVKEQLSSVLEYIIELAKSRNCIYIDFSMFGEIYHDILLGAGFNFLTDQDYCILPQVTSPIEDRPNLEYVGFSSNKFFNIIATLNRSDVYFTRMDSDRDRLALLSQIQTTL